MAKEKPVADDELRQTPYNEEAFDEMVGKDDNSSSDDAPELADFPADKDKPEGTEEDDGKTDIESKEQPKGEEDAKDSKDQDDDLPEGIDLPDWMAELPEDQHAKAVMDFLQLHEDIEKITARYESQSGQLKPTQRRLARMEELVKISATPKPGEDLGKRAAELEAWIDKHGEDFPDEAKSLKASFDAYKQAVATVEDDAKRYRSTLERTDDKVDRTLQRRNLERMDADVREISMDPSFARYLQEHPEQQAQAKSPFAHDVIMAVDQFRQDTQWQPPMHSEDFLNVDQMLASPIFGVWSRAIGLTAEQVTAADESGRAKVLHQFKVELDAAHKLDDKDPDTDDAAEAIRLAERRDKRKKDTSPKARSTGTGGGKPAALEGEAYFDQLEV